MVTEIIFDDSTNIVDLLNSANYLTDGWLGTSILVIIALIIFIAVKSQQSTDEIENFLITTFIMSIISSLLWFIGLVGMEKMLIFVVAFFIILLYRLFRSGER